MTLRQRFLEAASVTCTDQTKIDACWKEVEKAYAHKKRYYHNLDHLTHLANELDGIKSSIAHWDTVILALFYHDLIYNPLRSDNEEKSAARAASRLMELNVPEDEITRCVAIIGATKGHGLHADSDVNYFTDADLAILGSAENEYLAYFQKIRKEYSWYPDLLYNPGRKKILQHFLCMERLFKTEYFFEKYESQARQNLAMELRFLGEKP